MHRPVNEHVDPLGTCECCCCRRSAEEITDSLFKGTFTIESHLLAIESGVKKMMHEALNAWVLLYCNAFP